MSSSTVRRRDVSSIQPLAGEHDDNEEPNTEGIDEGLIPSAQPEPELWGDTATMAQVKLGGKQHDTKRAKKLRKTILETGIRMAFHMIMLGLYITIHVYFDDQYKKCPVDLRVKYFYGGIEFGGLWKYMTHICMWFVGVYFFIGFFTDIMPLSPAKDVFRRVADWFFTTIVWPLALTVCIMFWTMYLNDPKLIREYPELEECYPPTLNHALHSVPALCVLLECVLVYHSYPSHLMGCFSVLAGYSLYGIWVLVIFSVTQVWAYPFIGYMSPVMYVVGMFLFSMFGMFLYFTGRFISSVVWRERFRVVSEMEDDPALEYTYQDHDDSDEEGGD